MLAGCSLTSLETSSIIGVINIFLIGFRPKFTINFGFFLFIFFTINTSRFTDSQNQGCCLCFSFPTRFVLLEFLTSSPDVFFWFALEQMQQFILNWRNLYNIACIMMPDPQKRVWRPDLLIFTPGCSKGLKVLCSRGLKNSLSGDTGVFVRGYGCFRPGIRMVLF